MKKLIPLLRLSAKEYFKALKGQKFFSENIEKEVIISRSFYSHITKKPRNIRDMAERLAMFPLVPKILLYGLVSTEDENYIKLSYQASGMHLLSCILYKEKNGNTSLISCFQDFHTQKK